MRCDVKALEVNGFSTRSVSAQMVGQASEESY